MCWQMLHSSWSRMNRHAWGTSRPAVLAWVHDLVPAPDLKHVLKPGRVGLEVPPRDQLLPLPVVRRDHQAAEDRADVSDLLPHAAILRPPRADVHLRGGLGLQSGFKLVTTDNQEAIGIIDTRLPDVGAHKPACNAIRAWINASKLTPGPIPYRLQRAPYLCTR